MGSSLGRKQHHHVRGFEATTNLDPGQVLQQLANPRSPHGAAWSTTASGYSTDIFYSQLGAQPIPHRARWFAHRGSLG